MGIPAKLIPHAQSSAQETGTGDSIDSGVEVLFAGGDAGIERRKYPMPRRFVSTKELSEIWGTPESTLRYWRCAEVGPPYVKLGGRIKYDLADVELYVRANKRMPSVRAHGG
jgi:hypothetical protein